MDRISFLTLAAMMANSGVSENTGSEFSNVLRMTNLKLYGMTIPVSKYRISKSADGINFDDPVEMDNGYFNEENQQDDAIRYYKVEALVGGKWYGKNNIVAICHTKYRDDVPHSYVPFVSATALNNAVCLDWGAVADADKYYISEVVGREEYRDIETAYTGTNYIIDQPNDGNTHIYLVQAHVGNKWSPSKAPYYHYVTPRKRDIYEPTVTAYHNRTNITITANIDVADMDGLCWMRLVSGSDSVDFKMGDPLRSAIAITPGTGNYIDTHGAEWVADEIDFAAGNLIRRISSTGEIMPSPQIRALSSDQLAFWAAVSSKTGNVAVYNTANAYSMVELLQNTAEGRMISRILDRLDALES